MLQVFQQRTWEGYLSGQLVESNPHVITPLWLVGRLRHDLYRLLPIYRSPRQLMINEIFFRNSPVQYEILAMLQRGFSGN